MIYNNQDNNSDNREDDHDLAENRKSNPTVQQKSWNSKRRGRNQYAKHTLGLMVWTETGRDSWEGDAMEKDEEADEKEQVVVLWVKVGDGWKLQASNFRVDI